MATETETAAVAAEPQSLDAGTEYVIFARDDLHANASSSGPLWAKVGEANARSAEAAIRLVVGRLAEGKRNGTFVAVPSRSWKTVTVSEKVERTLVIGS